MQPGFYYQTLLEHGDDADADAEGQPVFDNDDDPLDDLDDHADDNGVNDGQPGFHYEYDPLDDIADGADDLVESVFVMGVIIMLLLMLMNGNI